MNLPLALNTILGPALVIALIFVNYTRKYNADRCIVSIFRRLLAFVFITMAVDFAFLLLTEIPGRFVHVFSYILGVLYYIFDVLAYWYIVIFVDYTIFKDAGRTKKLHVIVACIAVVHLAVLLLNVKYHFYFYIEPVTNALFRGDRYHIRVIFTYLPLVFSVLNIVFSRSVFTKSHAALMLLLFGLSFSGLTSDIVFGDMRLVWPGFSAAMLYAYFFILKSDSRLDSLTGIGNRFSFNEFTDRLSRSNSGESWAIVMLDMDHFKEINDTLGHLEGDNALRDMAAIILRCIPASAFAARYGGDEFVLAVKGAANAAGIAELMGSITAAVQQRNAQKIRPFKLELSYGYDVYTADGKRPMEEFLAHIDSLMYKNKQERRRASDKGGGR